MGSSSRRRQSRIDTRATATQWGRRPSAPPRAVPRLSAWLLAVIVVTLLAVGMHALYR